MKMIKNVAESLNGCQYGDEVTKEQRELMKANGIVVVYGYSDDGMTFDGAICDDLDAYYDGQTAYINSDGLIANKCANKCDDCPYYKKELENAIEIEPVWCKNDEGFSWWYKTDIPHETFNIMEEDELYCKGIVFDLSNLKESE